MRFLCLKVLLAEKLAYSFLGAIEPIFCEPWLPRPYPKALYKIQKLKTYNRRSLKPVPVL